MFSQLPLAIAVLLAAAGSPAKSQELQLAGVPSADLVEARVFDALYADLPADAGVSLRLPTGLPAEGQLLEDFQIDPRSGMFSARLVKADGTAIGFRGQALITVPALVPRDRIASGTILTMAHFEERMIAASSVPSGALRDPEALLGKETRRILLPDRPCRPIR